jgi:DNA adenine methylase
MTTISNKSPLRYPGGKTRACKILNDILADHFNPLDYDTVVSPFFGGGSFEFHLQNTYGMNIVANDKFGPLYTFWEICRTRKSELCQQLNTNLGDITKERFTELRKGIMQETDALTKATSYFIINRCSFSGATLSGGFSEESSKKRFTKSSIDRVSDLDLSKFSISNCDFSEFLSSDHTHTTYNNMRPFVFLDPPYAVESTLYGDNGDLHEQFDHKRLYECVSKLDNWMMTYNDCPKIRELYKEYTIIDTKWSYGMNRTKKSSEIVIISKEVGR